MVNGAYKMFDWLKKKTAKRGVVHETTEHSKSKPKASKAATKSEKELATEKGEPYVAVLRMDVDPGNLHQGAFELDWNEKFIANLIRAGYQGKSDSDIVDQWFQNVCRHVVMETWEQEQAIKNSGIYVNTRDLGNGRSEIS